MTGSSLIELALIMPLRFEVQRVACPDAPVCATHPVSIYPSRHAEFFGRGDGALTLRINLLVWD